MKPVHGTTHSIAFVLPNGSGAAAMLSAAIGSLVLAFLALAGDKSAAIKSALIFYKPTGALSGVTTFAILSWFLAWGYLEWRWGKRNVVMSHINVVSLLINGSSPGFAGEAVGV